MKTWPIRKMKIEDLHFAPYNPRIITADAAQGLKASISKFGMVEPIVWNEATGNVVGGHQRLRQLIELGETETDVVVVMMDTANEEIALNITLNNQEIEGDFNDKLAGVLDDVDVEVRKALKFEFMEEFSEYGAKCKDALTGVKEITLSDLSGKDPETCPCCGFEWEPNDKDRCDVENQNV